MRGTPATVLLIGDEQDTRRALIDALAQDGYQILEAPTGNEGLVKCFDRRPQLVLLDLGLPDVDGLEVTRQIREASQVPIIVVSRRTDESAQIEALDSGANDYVTMPFNEGELLARVRVALRWGESQVKPPLPLVAGALRVDPAERRVFMNGVEVELTRTEYKLLAAMIRQAGRVVSHAQLLREVWGAAYVKEVQYLRVYIKQLRAKLEVEPSEPKYLLTAPGIGYRLKVDF
jgi:two-component system KDP operon response regulator KdpE